MPEVRLVRKLKTSPDEVLEGTRPQMVDPASTVQVKEGHAGLNDHCPICGKEMEKGYLGMEKVFSDISWFSEKTTFGNGGKSLHIKDKLGIAYIDAYRCRGCHVIEAKY